MLRVPAPRSTKARRPRNAGPMARLPAALPPFRNIPRRVRDPCISLCKAGQALRTARGGRDYFYSAFEEIFAEREIFTLRFDSQRLVRLIGIVHGGDAG